MSRELEGQYGGTGIEMKSLAQVCALDGKMHPNNDSNV